jgi:broad specificity phosphatase PhoE
VRIGLLRHFPVDEKLPSGWKSAADMEAWRERYDKAETSAGEFDLGGVAWRACLSSDLPRARLTARAVFRGEVEHTALLREAQFARFKSGSLRLPLRVWQGLFWLSWLTGLGAQRACRQEFRGRVLAVADRLSALDQDTLVVSHGGMMVYLSAELRRRGFVGPRLGRVKHATAYIYERENREAATAPDGAFPRT